MSKCGRNHLGACRDGSNGCFKCGQRGHFMREFLITITVMVMEKIEPNLL